MRIVAGHAGLPEPVWNEKFRRFVRGVERGCGDLQREAAACAANASSLLTGFVPVMTCESVSCAAKRCAASSGTRVRSRDAAVTVGSCTTAAAAAIGGRTMVADGCTTALRAGAVAWVTGLVTAAFRS